jgi:anion-transporting  ArsA/GET3 family ATPase
VVDTPPSRSALDFLDAPARLSRFLDGRMLRLLVAPARPAGAACSARDRVVRALLQGAREDPRRSAASATCPASSARWTTTFGGFRERAEQTYRVLQAPETAFLVVAAPEPDAIREADYFAGRLAAENMPLHGSW